MESDFTNIQEANNQEDLMSKFNIEKFDFKERSMDDILQGDILETFLTRCAINVEFFIERVFGIDLEWYQKEWLKALRDNNRIAIQAFTSSGKTKIFIMYMLHQCFFQNNFKVLIVASSQPQSVRIIEEVQMAVETNGLLNEMKPSNPDSWSKLQVRFTNKSMVSSKTYSKNIKGEHVNLILCDEAASYKDHYIFFGFIDTRLTAGNGKMVVISTPEGPTDLMQRLFTPEFNGIYWRKAYPLMDENDKVISRRYTSEYIEHVRKRIGETAFQKEYLLKTVTSTESVFPPSQVMECFDSKIGFVRTRAITPEVKDEHGHVVHHESKTFFGCDFAVSGSAHADYSVNMIVEYVRDIAVIRFIDEKKGQSVPLQISTIKDLDNIYKPFQIFADSSNIGNPIIQEMRAQGIANVVPCEFHSAKRTEYLMNLKRMIEEKRIVIPRANLKDDTYAERLTTKLYKQLISFKTKQVEGRIKFEAIGHDDLVMALALACWGANKQRPYKSLFVT